MIKEMQREQAEHAERQLAMLMEGFQEAISEVQKGNFTHDAKIKGPIDPTRF